MDTTNLSKKFLYLNGEMNDEMTDSFLNFYGSLNETDEAVIYLNSSGGLHSSMQIMLDVINHSKFKTTLIAVERIMSCAFLLFYFAKCEKRLMEDCYGCVHMISSMFELRNKKLDEDIIRLKQIEELNKNIEEEFKSFLNDKEMREFKNGEDIYLSDERMKEIFN